MGVARNDDPRSRILPFTVLMVATCGLVYELIDATMASYLLGDSITQFSLVIGVYLSAMGLGSWLSRYVVRHLEQRFVQVQLLIAVFGGFSAPLLFLGFGFLAGIRPLLFGLLVVVGTLVGLEIPLLMRLGNKEEELKDLVARVLAFDYVGALLASIAFPLLLLPNLGLVRTSLACGLVNAGLAVWFLRSYGPEIPNPRAMKAACAAVIVALGGALLGSEALERWGEKQLYDAPVVVNEKTPYQKLVITRTGGDIRLYIDGNLQFSSADEYRYHEALVHPLMAAAPRHARVLVLGGGDGLALRELLRYDDVERVDLVDLDPAMTRLFSTHPDLVPLNGGAFEDPRVTVHNADAMNWLETNRREGAAPYDAILIDLPDPNNFSLGKLYTTSFYRLVATALAEDGALVVQSTSPWLAPRAFWCIVETLDVASLNPLPYHVWVPSFGEWGFVLASKRRRPAPTRLLLREPGRFIDDATMAAAFVFPRDLEQPDVEANRLDDQWLVQYYEADLRATLGMAPLARER